MLIDLSLAASDCRRHPDCMVWRDLVKAVHEK
jgi:hypothetical protein